MERLHYFRVRVWAILYFESKRVAIQRIDPMNRRLSYLIVVLATAALIGYLFPA